MFSRLAFKDYFLIWLALVVMGLLCRPLIPVDETRAVTVAWEMWQRGDFLVPHLNGQAYSHKPPLLQWCIQGLWWLLGVSEWSARLAAPPFALGSLVLTEKLAQKLWPEDLRTPKTAPLLLLATPVWALWSSLTLYDMLATFFTVLGLLGILHAARGKALKGFGIAGLALGGGLLAKGPAILLMVLPLALAAPGWTDGKPAGSWRRWYAGLLAATLFGAVIALGWAVPAAIAGGEEYRRLIFWGQSVGRISNSFAHSRPFWWYLAIAPALWLPWTLWPPLWRALKSVPWDGGLRFCATQALSAIVLFSLVSGKQVHYLLPVFPAMALLAARALSHASPSCKRRDQFLPGLLMTLAALTLFGLPWLKSMAEKGYLGEFADKTTEPEKFLLLGIGVLLLTARPHDTDKAIRNLTLAMLGFALTVHLAYRHIGWQYHDMRVMAERLATVEQKGEAWAYVSKYHGDFNFLGRLRHAPDEIYSQDQLLGWMATHPQGHVVIIASLTEANGDDGAEYSQYYRGKRKLMLWKSEVLLDHRNLLEALLRQAGV